MLLADARLLLTGATGGLGQALAQELADRGARLVLSARDREALERLREQLPGEHSVACADLADTSTAEALTAESGPLDGLVYAAGVPASGWLEELDSPQLSRAMRVNLEAPMQLALALLPSLRSRRRGHLCFVSSLAGKVPSPGLSVYVASKFGLRGFALALASELQGSGVEISVALPGFIGDRGMFAASGAGVPVALGAWDARRVARGVCDGIACARPETVTAPRRHRLIAHVLACAPRRCMSALSGADAVRTAREIAAGQRDMR